LVALRTVASVEFVAYAASHCPAWHWQVLNVGGGRLMAKPEFLVINIGAGVQEGASATVVGVAESMDAAKELIRTMRANVTDRIVIAERKTVITRTPVVELKERDESVLVNPEVEAAKSNGDVDDEVTG
jgi:hypothetical protein